MDLRPGTVLDVRSRGGWYSRLAALRGARVVAFDTEEAHVRGLYCQAKRQDLAILPLSMDFLNPSPGYGAGGRWAVPAIERFRCELVLALDLVHDLVTRQCLPLETIIGALAAFSQRWLLMEFVPPPAATEHALRIGKGPRYRLDELLSCLHSHFHTVEVYASDAQGNRLLLCGK
jgi:hypothetical protein